MKIKIALFSLCVLAVAALPASAGAIGAPPTVTVTAPANNSFASAAAPALTFTTTGTAVSKTCTLTGPGVDEYYEGCTSPYKPLATLPEGTYTYGVSVSNTDGSAAASRTFKVDRTNPTITVTAGPAEGTWTNAAGAAVTVSVTDANPAFLNCRMDDGLWEDCSNASPTGGTNSAPALSEGSHRFWFFATDKAGNTWSIFRQINFDRTAPYAAIDITGGSTQTKDNTPAFVLGAGDNYGAVSRKCRLVGETTPVDCSASTWLLTDPIGDGDHTAELTVTDNAGNSSVATEAFTVDSTMPTVTYGGFEGDKTSNTQPQMEFWVDDAHEGTARCGFDPADWDQLTECNEGGGHVPAAPLALGFHQFWIDAVDTFGNSSSTIYTFEVVAPQVENPGPGSGPTGGGGAPSAAVTVKTASTKVKKGKFTLTVTVTATGVDACRNAEIVIAPKVKKAKSFMVRSVAKTKGGACVATAKIRLAAKFKKKRATVTGAQNGLSKKVTIKL